MFSNLNKYHNYLKKDLEKEKTIDSVVGEVSLIKDSLIIKWKMFKNKIITKTKIIIIKKNSENVTNQISYIYD